MININEIILAILRDSNTIEMFYDMRLSDIMQTRQVIDVYQYDIYASTDYNIGTVICDLNSDTVTAHIKAYSGNDNDFDFINVYHIIHDGNGYYLESQLTGELLTVRKRTIKKAVAKKSVSV